MMSRAQGQLSVFAIAVIFVLVFAGMYQINAFAENPDLPEDPAEGTEELVREAVWERVNEHRSEVGRFAAPSTGGMEIEAQKTAEQLKANGGIREPIASGSGITTEPRLPNPGARCTQLAVPVELTETDAVPVPMTVRDAIADEAMAGFLEIDSIGVIERRAWADNGVGVALDGTNSTAYVVYRSCSTRRSSP